DRSGPRAGPRPRAPIPGLEFRDELRKPFGEFGGRRGEHPIRKGRKNLLADAAAEVGGDIGAVPRPASKPAPRSLSRDGYGHVTYPLLYGCQKIGSRSKALFQVT